MIIYGIYDYIWYILLDMVYMIIHGIYDYIWYTLSYMVCMIVYGIYDLYMGYDTYVWDVMNFKHY